VEIVELASWWPQEGSPISLRCPSCRQIGTFDVPPSSVKDLLSNGNVQTGVFLGSRRCPNDACHAHVFTVWSASAHALVASYPPETIDFNAANLPKPVLDSLDEAIRCHAAQCYRAAAVMVRRTLEDLCADRNASGANLKTRLESLSGRIAVATALVEGLDTLRLLGNDAAHVDLKDFDAVGKTEAELAIEIAKELLKGIYQYEDLVARLEALKRPTP
jgi:hypothetical protein